LEGYWIAPGIKGKFEQMGLESNRKQGSPRQKFSDISEVLPSRQLLLAEGSFSEDTNSWKLVGLTCGGIRASLGTCEWINDSLERTP
jgi:hypothetical protein